MRSYELMTIHRPGLAEEEVRDRIADLATHLGQAGATVAGTDVWGKRRFAYEIDHQTEGYYTVFGFDADPDAIDIIDRLLTLQDEVVRHKFTRPGE